MPRKSPHPAKSAIVGAGETLTEAAAAVGVNAHTFGRVLNGHVAPWPALSQRLAQHLGLEEADLWHTAEGPEAAA